MAGTIVSDTVQDGTGNSCTTTQVVKGAARAWVNFNMANPPVINGTPYNVSSITRITTGQYTVNFTTAMPNANYCATFNSNNGARYQWFDTFTTTSLNVYSFSSAYDDTPLCCVAVFSY